MSVFSFGRSTHLLEIESLVESYRGSESTYITRHVALPKFGNAINNVAMRAVGTMAVRFFSFN